MGEEENFVNKKVFKMIFRINRMCILKKNSLRNIFLNQPKIYFCSSESEEHYFNLQPNKRNESKKKGYVPIRKILATTNKNDFGPLLETTKEKRQRLKYEALGKEIPKKSKKRQMERRMKDEHYESLLDKPENSLFNYNQTRRQNIKYLDSIKREKIDMSRKILKKIPGKVV